MKNRLRLIALLPALWISAGKSYLLGQESRPPLPVIHASPFANLLDSLRYSLDVPALAGAIVTDETIVEAQAVGCRRYCGSTNVTIEDRFHLGSETKAFTAMLLGVLVDQGLVDWTTTLSTIFPQHAASMRSEYRDVTVRDVLSHSAGFMCDPGLTYLAGTPKEERAVVVAWALTQQPVTARGHYLYSNMGYIVAGAIVEQLTGRPFEDLLFERILGPLGITTAGFGPMGTPGLEDQPLQHKYNHTPVEPTPEADNPPIYGPAGRLHMAIGGWAKFIRWVLAAEAGHQTLLKPATAAMLTTAVVPDDSGGFYALGWGVSNQALSGGRTLTHAGSNTLNYAIAWLAPEKHFGVIVAANQGAAPSTNPINAAATRMIQYYLNGR